MFLVLAIFCMVGFALIEFFDFFTGATKNIYIDSESAKKIFKMLPKYTIFEDIRTFFLAKIMKFLEKIPSFTKNLYSSPINF